MDSTLKATKTERARIGESSGMRMNKVFYSVCQWESFYVHHPSSLIVLRSEYLGFLNSSKYSGYSPCLIHRSWDSFVSGATDDHLAVQIDCMYICIYLSCASLFLSPFFTLLLLPISFHRLIKQRPCQKHSLEMRLLLIIQLMIYGLSSTTKVRLLPHSL